MTRDNTKNNKRIAKNTILLYIRMILIMAVSLYTSRIILNALGIQDYGIYNIIGGIVILFTFINNALVTSTQRFLNFEIGKDSKEEANKVFNSSLVIHIVIAVIFIGLAETIGLAFFKNFIQIPKERINAASVVYQLSVLTTVINFLRTPYNAAIIAYEKMKIYAYISIVEVLLKLLAVYLLYLFSDRLITYSVIITIIALIIWLIYFIYCRLRFDICKFRINFNKTHIKSIACFSGWNLFGSAANISADQGSNIILNSFFGVTVNAAVGISSQVNTAVYQFVSNFQTAFNPQIIKSYAANDKEYFISIILNTSRYSFFLLAMLALPIIVCCNSIMQIWLTDVPPYSTDFCRLMLVFSLIDALQGPLWISAQATGKIKKYQILISSIILLNIPLSYFMVYLTHNPLITITVRVFINVVAAIARVIFLNKLYGFPIVKYLKEVIVPCLVVFILALPIPYYLYSSINNPIYSTIIGVSTSFLVLFILILCLGITKQEKKLIMNRLSRNSNKRLN